uniref:Outer membrane protein TolC n=1 Tax=Candidatus Kentrum sp. FM TaxID=2126340 RepID=A0A450S0W0_9GAMM|nr:MAG: Outer membrane protein TolC [Candidatus Kentron sp. FM]VFJ51530.1 MAG: Outer membrane protein TolC [Candidatus Kentron sp. FM]VFK05894.1 MAG: Outer membrane protein TolC [Candidatus Kentron sp. FM]
MKRFFIFSLSALVLAGCAVTQEPYTAREFEELSQKDLERFPQQEPITQEITLEEAMARAVKYNLKRQVELMQEDMAHNQAMLAKFSMLPSLDVEGGYDHRDTELIFDSYNIETGETQDSNTINTENETRTASAMLVWNVLDFGVSYSLAKQASDQELMARERKRRAVQEILRDVREAYWRAAGSDMMKEELVQLSEHVLRALRLSETTQAALLENPQRTLLYQRSLLDILMSLKEVQAGVIDSKAKLTTLMGLAPGTAYSLKKPPRVLPIQRLRFDMEEMERRTLRDHPALHEAHYQTRFAAEEARKEIKRLFPGLEFSVGGSYDSNKYLHNQSWATAGVQMSWNLFSLFSAPRRIETAKRKKELVEKQRLELTMALLTRLHVGRAQYELALENFQLADCLEEVGDKLHELNLKSRRANTSNDLDVIRSRVDLLRAQMRRTVKYADLQASIALLKESTGLNLLPDILPSYDLEALRAAIREQRQRHEEDLEYVGHYCRK